MMAPTQHFEKVQEKHTDFAAGLERLMSSDVVGEVRVGPRGKPSSGAS